MKMEAKEKQLFYRYILLTAVVCGSILCLVFALRDYFPGQKITFTYGDYYAQFYPACVSFWRAVLEGKDISFSFSNSMGMPTMAWYAYVAMSPIGILLYLIPDLETASFMVFVIKMMLAAVAFWIFAVTQLKTGYREALYFANAYALSAYSISFFVNIHYMDVLYIAPLLGISLMRYIRLNKRIGLVLVYAFSFINMFLSGYSLGVFSFVVFISLLWFLRQDKNQIIKLLWGYFCIVLIAALISMATVIPIVSYVKMHMDSGSSFSAIALIDFLELPVAFMFNSSNGTIFNARPAIYCGWPVLLLVVVYFLDRMVSKRERVLAAFSIGFLMICMLWRPAYLMMHAFDEPDSFAWRFSYLMVFALVTIACRAYTVVSAKIEKKKIFFSAGGLMICMILSVLYSSIKYGNTAISLSIIIMNLVCVIFAAFSIVGRNTIVIYGLIEVLVASLFLIPRFGNPDAFLQSSQRKELESIRKGIREIEGLESEKNFYRISVNYGESYNFAMLYNYKALTFFSSLEDTALWKNLYKLGFFARAQQVSYYGQTEFTNMIFSIRYQMDLDQNGNNVVTKQEKVLPIAFGVSDRILEYEGKGDPFENQNDLATFMAAEDVQLFSRVEQTLIPGNGVDLVWNDEKKLFQASKTGEDSSLIWAAGSSDYKEIYTYCMKDSLSVSLNEKAYIVSGIPGICGSDTAIPFSCACIVPMAELEKSGQSVATIYLTGENGSMIEYTDLICAAFDRSEYERLYQTLSKGSLRVTKLEDNEIEGDIYLAPERSVLFTSIPYDPGWRVIVDGMQKESFATVGGTFLAAKLDPGDHHIRLVYRDESLKIGGYCSILGIILLGVMTGLQKRQSKPSKNSKGIEDIK